MDQLHRCAGYELDARGRRDFQILYRGKCTDFSMHVAPAANFTCVLPLKRTTGSHIEVKKSSITWHYRSSDPEWGLFQCRQCQDLLENNLSRKRPIEGELASGRCICFVFFSGSHLSVIDFWAIRLLLGRTNSPSICPSLSPAHVAWSQEDIVSPLQVVDHWVGSPRG